MKTSVSTVGGRCPSTRFRPQPAPSDVGTLLQLHTLASGATEPASRTQCPSAGCPHSARHSDEMKRHSAAWNVSETISPKWHLAPRGLPNDQADAAKRRAGGRTQHSAHRQNPVLKHGDNESQFQPGMILKIKPAYSGVRHEEKNELPCRQPATRATDQAARCRAVVAKREKYDSNESCDPKLLATRRASW